MKLLDFSYFFMRRNCSLVLNPMNFLLYEALGVYYILFLVLYLAYLKAVGFWSYSPHPRMRSLHPNVEFGRVLVLREVSEIIEVIDKLECVLIKPFNIV